MVLTGKAVSFVTSPLHVPLRRIFVKGEPADGKEACAEVWGGRDGVGSDEGGETTADKGAEPRADDERQRAADGEERGPGQDLQKGVRPSTDQAEEAPEDSPEDKPAIDALNLSE
ncbi:MAG: hypothetical protein U9Q81_10200 [Pseudomonadota bacterium]|nr:hypothetical protein [Pseudomonadota bacterium]